MRIPMYIYVKNRISFTTYVILTGHRKIKFLEYDYISSDI